MSALRLLLASACFPAGVGDVGYTMSADEVAYWQDQAALLDPDAYEYTHANTTSDVVPSGKRWYLVNGWSLDATGSGGLWFQRPAHVDRAFLLSEGTTIATGTAPAGEAFMYICKPELVVDEPTDDRYADYQSDPRALWFERIMHLATLEQFQIGATNSGSSTTDVAFPGGFTDGMSLHVSSHDVAWLIMVESGDDGGLNTLNELSDLTPQIRFAEPVLFPFKTATFPEIRIQGSGIATGRATMTYAKLPAGW